jgi:glyoxylase-like metal-dependent hydrolase (beta-lactamase superfamily II)
MPTTLQKTSTAHQVGDVTVTRLSEIGLDDSTPATLFPDWRPELIDTQGSLPFPGSWDTSRTRLHLSIHTWVVRTPQHTILIDTGSGNDKPRPFFSVLDHLKEPYLERLHGLGVRPQDVDFVLLTHLHIDHVGWNTEWVNGRWRPTFPKAKYVMSKLEFEHFASPGSRDDPRYRIFEDSVLPVIESGQAEFVSPGGGQIVEGIEFLSTPGHSPDHMSIALRSKGQEALFGGDVLHHPLQVLFPHLNSVFCESADLSRVSRDWALNYSAEHEALYFSTHFPESSAGRITRRDNGFDWRYL